MRTNWGAIVIGGLTGLVLGAVLAAILIAVGIGDTSTFGGQSALLLVTFLTQVVAGFVAARFAGFDHGPAQHGGMAAIALYGVVAAIAVAAGTEPSIGSLVFGAIVAVVLGTAGGVLAAALTDRND